MSLNIIGISAHYHDAACCILRDGELVAAAEEERFSRRKHDARMPSQAFRYCLERAGLTLPQIDCIAYYESPERKLSRQIWCALADPRAPLPDFDPGRPRREFATLLGYEGPVEYVEHHLSHAASAYYFAGAQRAAVLTVDGVGEWSTTSFGIGCGPKLELLETIDFPDSLGLFYSTLTSYLGFRVNEDEYKVMGLAPYGEPKYVERLRRMIELAPGGRYRLDMDYFDFVAGRKMYTNQLEGLLGAPPRAHGAMIEPFHCDVARSLQAVLEEGLLHLLTHLKSIAPCDTVCLAGGVFHNCAAVGRIRRDGPFRELFVQPAAGDAGGALGAAAVAHGRRSTERSVRPLEHLYLGPESTSEEVAALLRASGLPHEDYCGRPLEFASAVAHRLAQGKVVGWFQGRMEFGPRALGARSILADPREAHMRDRINAAVKKREAFRPFAPVVLGERARGHFAIERTCPYMMETVAVTSPLALPAIRHVDGSARLQTLDASAHPRLAELLRAFERATDCPVLLNTSFNVAGEPIVCAPEDAVACFIASQIDCLAIEEFVIDRDRCELALLAGILANRPSQESRIGHEVYTFL